MNQPTLQKYSVHPATRMGHVSLNVANIENQILFYEKAMGFKHVESGPLVRSSYHAEKHVD
ncbi:hypothetical protein FBQ87_09895 [Sphingobacteriales bacterium CHB3]|nr:hypothetical protein [Sphingobacteriales bacterium CHB3]